MTRRGASVEEIEEVYRRRLPEFRRVAAAVVGERESARDVVQEAFATAVQRRAEFRGEGPLEAWLWRIVVNRARSDRRSATPVGEAPSRHGPHANGGAEDAGAAIRLAVSLLPERQRLVLFLRYYADLDYQTIGEVAEIAPGTVGATLTAARSSLQRLLEEART